MKKPFLVASALVLSFSSLGVISPKAYATAQTCTWTGGGSDSKFSTAANWSNCNSSVPQTGDALTFNASVLSGNSYVTLNNDITGLSVTGITFSGTVSGYTGFIIGGSALSVSGAIASTVTDGSGYTDVQTISAPLTLAADTSVSNVNLDGNITTAGHTLSLSSTVVCGQSVSGNISGASSVVVASTAAQSGVTFSGDNSGFTGTFTADDNTAVGFMTTASLGQATNLTSTNAQVNIGLEGADRSISTFANLGGHLYVTRGYASGYGCGGASSSGTTVYNLTFANGASLNGDLEYNGDFSNAIVSQPYSANGHVVTTASGSNGSITLPSGAIEVQPVTNEYNDSDINAGLSVGNKQTAILNGTRRYVSVGYGGLLNGSGTITASLNVDVGGIVAPGHSPGCLTSDTLSLSGEYQFELGGTDPCSGYDQLIVKNTGDATGAVIIDDASATLTTSRYNNYTPKQGQVFIIIDQAGDKAVSGTFKDLPEGATFTQNGIVFKISYVGGDGNDVTLTVQNSPTAPDTGVQILKANPAVIAVGTAIAVLALLGLARRARQ